MTCFECGAPAIHQHHVVPRIRGGTRTVPLCGTCHGKVHGLSFGENHAELIREGIEKARERGVKLGRPWCVPNVEHMHLVAELGPTAAGRKLGLNRTTLRRQFQLWKAGLRPALQAS